MHHHRAPLHRARSHRRRIPAVIATAVLVAGMGITVAAGTAAAGSGADIVYVGGTGASDTNACSTTEAPCATLDAALEKVASGKTIEIQSDLEVTAQVTITEGVTIDGNGHTIATTLDNSTAKNNDNNAVLGVRADGVTIDRLTVDGAGGHNVRGINAYLAQGLSLNDVTIQNTDTVGLLVIGSSVTATNLNTSGNIWGSVNVDTGAGTAIGSTFTMPSGDLGDATQIWSDGINTGGTVTVDAEGYDEYQVHGVTDQPNLRMWAKDKPLSKAGAYFVDTNNVRQFYASPSMSLQNALDAADAAGAETVSVNHQVTINTPTTIDGHGLTVSPDPDFNASRTGTDTQNNAVFGVQFVVGAVVIKNLTIDGADGPDDYTRYLRGINAYNAADLTLENVTIKNNETVGLLVIGSDVTATNLNTSGNGWGSVNVDPGEFSTGPSEFTLEGDDNFLDDPTQIWSDGKNVDGTRTVAVTAPGYDEYQVHGVTGQPNLRMWAKNKPLPKMGAYFVDLSNIRQFYTGSTDSTGIQDAVNAAMTASNDAVFVNPGDYTGSVTIDGPLTIRGADGSDTTGGTVSFEVTAAGPVAIHRFAFTGTGDVITTNGPTVDASGNYWGSASPDFGTLVSGNVTYAPWYIDSAMTILPSAGDGQQDQASPASGVPATANVAGANATATGSSGTVTLAALPTVTVGSIVAGVGSAVTPTKVVDLSVSAAAGVTQIVLEVCDVGGATRLQWYDGAAWHDVSPVVASGGCLIATITPDLFTPQSSPTIEQLTGTVFAAVKTVSTPGGGTGGTSGDGAGSTPTPGTSADRVAGSNRYATAALIAEQFGSANAIVIANGENAKDGVDALSANYLAGKVHAPILLTQAGTVSTDVISAVKKVLAGAASPTVYVMGGTDSVFDTVAGKVKAAAVSVASGTVTVVRVGGTDRYATSALAAAKVGSVDNSLKFAAASSAAKTAILASGQVNADALAAGALSNAWGIPVLLATSGKLPSQVAAVISSQKITQLLVLGGTDRISQAVLDQAKAAGVTTVKRIAGADRYATAAQLYGFAMGTMVNGSGDHYGPTADGVVYLANGTTGFPDALAVGPLAGKTQSPLLTTAQGALGSAATSFLSANKGALSSVTGLGKAATVSAAVLTAGNAALK